VRRRVLAHKRVGLSGIYDTYDRFPERRTALEQWADFVAGLIDPRPAKVVRIRRIAESDTMR
jgi:hypothetical protein